jgi:hypothetical protein
VIVSVYSGGVEAYRETTKWLTAFLPVTALVTAAVVAGPGLVRSVQVAPSPGAWVSDHWLVLVCAVALFAGIAAILACGARVLSVQPLELAYLDTDAATKAAVAEVLGAGAAIPEFFDKSSFDRALGTLAAAYDSPTAAVDEQLLDRLRTASETLREWSVHSRLEEPFRQFRRVFVGASVAIALAVVLGPVQLDDSASIREPVVVQVTTDAPGARDLEAETGCTAEEESTYLAVDGTWRRPHLAVDGPGCRFGAEWVPDPEHVEIRPVTR